MFSVQKSNWFRFLFKYYSQEWKWQSNSKSIHYTTVSKNITLNSLWSRKMPTFIYKILIINENICYFPISKMCYDFFSADQKTLSTSSWVSCTFRACCSPRTGECFCCPPFFPMFLALFAGDLMGFRNNHFICVSCGTFANSVLYPNLLTLSPESDVKFCVTPPYRCTFAAHLKSSLKCFVAVLEYDTFCCCC